MARKPQSENEEVKQTLDPGHGVVESVEPVVEAVETTPEQPVTPERTIHKHSQRLLREANEFGIDQDVIDNTPSDQLDEMVYRLNRQAKQFAREQQKAERDHSVRERIENPPPAPVDESSKDPLDAEDFEGYGEPVKAMRDRIRKLEKLLEEQNGKLSGVETKVKNREAVTGAEMLDEAFSALGEKYTKILGTDASEGLDPQGKEMARRRRLLRNAGIDPADLSGYTRKQITKMIRDEADLLYGDVLQEPKSSAGAYTEPEPERDPLEDKKQAWLEAGLARPTQRIDVTEPPSRSKAIRAVKKFREEQTQADSGRSTESFKI